MTLHSSEFVLGLNVFDYNKIGYSNIMLYGNPSRVDFTGKYESMDDIFVHIYFKYADDMTKFQLKYL